MKILQIKYRLQKNRIYIILIMCIRICQGIKKGPLDFLLEVIFCQKKLEIAPLEKRF
jgi:hypothetical protein